MAWIGEAMRDMARRGLARHGFLFKENVMYLIDTNGLGPGDVIDELACKGVIGTSETEDPKGWQLGMLALSTQVALQLKKQHGRELTVRIKDNSLWILTDQQASEYNPKRFDAGLKLARRAHRRLMAVDRSGLTVDQRQTHDNNVRIQAFKLSMLRKKESSELVPVQRTSPVVLKKN